MPGVVTCEKHGKGQHLKPIRVSYIAPRAVPACGQSKHWHWGTRSWLSCLLSVEQMIIACPWGAGIIDRK